MYCVPSYIIYNQWMWKIFRKIEALSSSSQVRCLETNYTGQAKHPEFTEARVTVFKNDHFEEFSVGWKLGTDRHSWDLNYTEQREWTFCFQEALLSTVNMAPSKETGKGVILFFTA